MSVPLLLKVYKDDALVVAKAYDRDIIKIGRLASAHLCLEDEKVSRIHSVIEVGADGALSIIDMGSVEGTYVNGKRVNKGALALGDTIRVGNTTVVVEGGEGGVPLEASPSQSVVNEVTQVAAIPAVEPPRESQSVTQVHRAAHPEEPPAPMPIVRSRPERRSKAGPLGLELRFMWGDQRVGGFLLKPGTLKKGFTVGSGEGADFTLGDSKTGTPLFPVVTEDSHGFSLHFTGKMNGELHRQREVLELNQVIETGKASHEGDAYSLALETDDFAWIDLGGVVLEASYEPLPKPVLVPLLESIDFSVLNVFLVMFFIGALFVITAENRNLEGDEYADELSNDQARIAKLIIKPPEVRKNPLLQKLVAQKEKKSGEIAAKARGDEGQMGRKDAPMTGKHTAPKGQPNNKDIARQLTQKIFGSGAGGISTVMGKGLGGELKAAMGNMFGNAPGDSGGMGGLGLRGSGSGGGGVGDTIGIGGIGTKGRGGGTSAYGSGVGVLGGKKDVDIGITSSEPVVMGSLDKELIRQVIHRNRGQIRFCYESQLQRYPKLQGKVSVKFVIAASGSVASSSVAQSTAGNSELETCVAGRVRTWMFPKPKGGGVVIVTYPFIFKQSGE